MADFRLEMWDERGLAFDRRANTPDMQSYLGGVEADSAVAARHQRILGTIRSGAGEFYLILVPDAEEPVGSIGFWERELPGAPAYELGWKVLPRFQGRGLAGAATSAALKRAAAFPAGHRWAHAFPRVDNAASNAICARAGFEPAGETDFEYPAGTWIRCNDWRYDLRRADR